MASQQTVDINNQPPPIPVRKCSSLQNIASPSLPVSNMSEKELTHPIYQVMFDAIMRDVRLCLPAIIHEELSVQIVPAMSKAVMEESIFQTPPPTTKTHNPSDTIVLEKDYVNKLNGYKAQVEYWIGTINYLTECVNDLKKEVATLKKGVKATDKTLSNQKKECDKTKEDVKNQLTLLKNLKADMKPKLENINAHKNLVNHIESSQKFVSAEYDDMVWKNADLQKEVDKIKERVTKQANKLEHTSNYTHWDNVQIDGVNVCNLVDRDGNEYENCKQMVVDICKELHYNLPITEISTAHRLKHHPNKPGPPSMVVRFKSRDIRNDVFRLKKAARDKTHWRNFNIEKLYINEHLTPEKKKLMYYTKLFTKEMYRIHGKIYAWSFKGEIYVRKGVDGAEKIKINSEEDLNSLRRGEITLDPPNPSNLPSAVHVDPPPTLSLEAYPLLGGEENE